MKILMMNHFPLEGSGSGIYTRNLAESLVSFGHEVMVIYPEHSHVTYETFKCMPVVFKSDTYNTDDPVDIPFDFPCFTSHPRSHYTFYDMDQVQIETYVEVFKRKMFEAIDQFNPDLIHAQHLWIMPYIAAMSGIPYFVTAHGTDLKGYAKDARYHQYAEKGAEKAQKIVTISKQVDEAVTEIFGTPSKQKALILNGYNTALFKLKSVDKAALLKSFNIDYHGEKIVFFAGKLAYFKGVDVLLKATKIVEASRGTNLLTLIAGNGELGDDLKEQKAKDGLRSVHFLGHIYQEVLADLYNIADVSCVPSRNEPFGLVAIEALACGAPVVGTNQGGLPDFIVPEIGELVPVEDEVALANAIESLLSKNEERSMRTKCNQYAFEHFSRDKSALKVEALYKTLE